MAKKYIRESKAIAKAKEIIEVQRIGCGDDNKVVAQYHPATKTFISMSRYGSGEPTSLTAMFALQFGGETGSADSEFKDLCSIPDFSRLYVETVGDAQPKQLFTRGERVVYDPENHSSYRYRKQNYSDAKVLVVQEVVGYRQDNKCTPEGDVPPVEPVYVCTDSRTGDEVVVAEHLLKGISVLEEFVQGHKIVDAIKTKFRKEGVLGAIIIFDGKAYEF